MIYKIENDCIAVQVNSVGCELWSVCDKHNGHEYLWQGDPAWWSGRSPILFPIVGRLIDDSYLLNGRRYTMPKHGFVRKNENWTLIEKDQDLLRFMISENEETLRNYPYCFDLIVTFQISDAKLRVTHTVVNNNKTEMFFSIGAHPAFECEIGDKIVFDENETLSTEKIDLEKSLRLPEAVPVLQDEKELRITEDIFKEDALIFHDVKSECVTLYPHNGSYRVRFNMGNSPYLGIWAKPGAPYVCLEPWWGVNDSQTPKRDFSEKDCIQKLPAEEIFQCFWEAVFS